jgi:uncharacterized protein YlxP (DUF503 family)
MDRRSVFFPDVFVGILLLSVEISWSRSVKDRRSVVKSILDRVRARWDVSAIDLGPDGILNRAFLGFSSVAPSSYMAVERLDAVRGFVESMQNAGEFDILEYNQEVERYDHFSHTEDQ